MSTGEHAVRRARLDEALRADDIDEGRRLLNAWVDDTRSGAVGETGALADALVHLLAHTEPRIRQTVAGAADLLPEALFNQFLTTLSRDDDHYVRVAIERAAHRRARQTAVRARETADDRRAAELLTRLEGKHGKRARAQAVSAGRLQTEYFVRSLHHEVSKIATPLEIALTRLRSELAKPDLDRATLARNVNVALDRFKLMWSVLERARESSATVVPRFEHAPLLPLLEKARADLKERLGARGERLAVDLHVERDLCFEMDRSALHQAVQNFLQNAAEAHPDEAERIEITVSARSLRVGSQIELTIADRGAGMNEEERALLFVPFGSRKPGGTGVGLVIARKMIEEVHQGTLALESAVGEGTTVRIVLPARPAGAGRQRG